MQQMTFSLRTVIAVSRAAGFLVTPFLRSAAILRDDALSRGRTGMYPDAVKAKAPYDIWLHAVSVGEVSVAHAVVQELIGLEPGLNLVVSSTTPAGLKQAEKVFDGICQVVPAPLDLPGFAERALKTLRPALYACVETEIWPNILHAAQASGVHTAVINGRISDSSFPSYMRIRGVVSPLLYGMRLICAVTEKNAGRFTDLGACESRVTVTGNAKYAGLIKKDVSSFPSFPFSATIKGRKVWTAGSIRSGEEEMALAAHKKILSRFPDALLFMVPRHMKNVVLIKDICKGCGITPAFFSKGEIPAGSSVCIVDAIGHLFDLYGVSRASFVGGSLVPRGGQNVMEPAAWGRPVIHGPHMSNFEDAMEMLKKEGGDICVRDADELADTVMTLFQSRKSAEEKGRAARAALEKAGRGAALRQAELLLRILAK